MKARMMWMGAVVGVLALTGCQQRDNGANMQTQDNPAQQGAQGPRGETGTGGMIPERGVEEHTIGGIGGGTDAEENAATGGSGKAGAGGGARDAGMAPDAGTGGSGMGLEDGSGTGGESMQRTQELDQELQRNQQSGETGDQDSNQ
jgi:hypothetical protein